MIREPSAHTRSFPRRPTQHPLLGQMPSIEGLLGPPVVRVSPSNSSSPPEPPSLDWPDTFPELLPHVHIEDVHGAGDSLAFELWPHLVERATAWGAGSDDIVLKARQLGITWLAAAYARYVARRRGAKVLVISKGQRDSYAFLDKVRFIDDHLPADLQQSRQVDNEGEMSWLGGGAILALPATKEAGRGFTGSLVIIDEAAFHPWAAVNYKAYRPTVADGGQLLIVSTANGKGGFFYEQWGKAASKLSGYNAVFIPWHSRPDRDAAWYAREKENYQGLPAEFQQEYPATPEEAFVQLTGLVYPQFSEARHVRPDPVAWEACLYRYGGVDLGGGDPTAIVLLGVYRDAGGTLRVQQYDEYRKTTGAPTVDEMFQYLSPWHELARFTVIEGDAVPGADTVNASLAALGLPVRRTFSQRWEGLGVQAQFLENDWLTINPACTHSIQEFAGYRWLQRTDPNSKDRYATATPHDHHGDAMDARRRALYAIYRDLMVERERIDAYSGVDL